MRSKTGYIYSPLYLQHVLSPGHPESPERLKAIESEMERIGLHKKLTPLHIEIEDERVQNAIRYIHTEDHIASVRKMKNSGSVALHAVKGVLQGVDDIIAGTITNAFCAVRPPGHHSHNNTAHCDGRDQGEGFCFFNNVAIAARYAQQDRGIDRVLVIDWDYHHGNGTEWSFYSDPSVFFFSTHILYGYPGTGSPDKYGEGPGEGYNVNVPLDTGAEDADIIGAWEKNLFPALEKSGFSPDIVIISAGFDSRENDYLGTFAITDRGFAQLTRLAMDIAEEHCSGKLLSVLEGGYNPQGLAKAVAAHVETLLGRN